MKHISLGSLSLVEEMKERQGSPEQLWNRPMESSIGKRIAWMGSHQVTAPASHMLFNIRNSLLTNFKKLPKRTA